MTELNKKFTAESLKNYDGKNGRPAYIAVDGIVYDVTNNSHWTNGDHHGLTAGQALSKDILKSPHGHSILHRINKVGTYTTN